MSILDEHTGYIGLCDQHLSANTQQAKSNHIIIFSSQTLPLAPVEIYPWLINLLRWKIRLKELSSLRAIIVHRLQGREHETLKWTIRKNVDQAGESFTWADKLTCCVVMCKRHACGRCGYSDFRESRENAIQSSPHVAHWGWGNPVTFDVFSV